MNVNALFIYSIVCVNICVWEGIGKHCVSTVLNTY